MVDIFEARNSHLNVFKAWRQQEVLAVDGTASADMAIENNLTRALAIVLEREHAFAIRFAQMLDERRTPVGGKLALNAIKHRCAVAIEVPGEDLELEPTDAEKIIPVLVSAAVLPLFTAVELVINEQVLEQVERGTRLDLVCRVGDFMVLVEAKRHDNANEAYAQMRRYLQGFGVPHLAVVHLSWQELQHEARSILNGRNAPSTSTVLEDFVNFLTDVADSLHWRGLDRPLGELLATNIFERDSFWRRNIDLAVDLWVRQVGSSEFLPQADVQDHLLDRRFCVRVNWQWAKEINFRICAGDRCMDRANWLASGSQAITGIDAYLTIGDTLAQIRALQGRTPWQVTLDNGWSRQAFVGFMDAWGRGVHVSISEAQSTEIWNYQNPGPILSEYRRDIDGNHPASPFPGDWAECNRAWVDYWTAGQRTVLRLTARVQFHMNFPVTQVFTDAQDVAKAFNGLRKMILNQNNPAPL